MTPDFASLPKGLASKPKDADDAQWLYILPTSMMSSDDDTGNMRCGQLSTFQCTAGGKWIGITVSQLFKRTWNPDNASLFRIGGDPKETIIGKAVYVCEWQGKERADVTQDKNVAKPGKRIGVVFSHTDNMAYILMDDEFTASRRFVDEGFWAQAGC